MQDATELKNDIWLAGVDGCRGGWIVALVRPDGDEARVQIVPRFSELAAARPAPAIVRVFGAVPLRNLCRRLRRSAPKIREVDAALRADGALAARTFEIHPEVAFWRLNADAALSEPKKVKSRCHEPGLALRRHLLIAAGLPRAVVEGGPDDLLDALACAAIARRIHAGIAKSFPQSPPRDAYGLPMAIWA